MDLGACEYINKPFETNELLAMIRNVAASQPGR
jgi:DNA-binding response OmpR family regulator